MTFEKIREMLSRQMDIPEESITMDSRLVEDLKADSLDVVELIMDIEQEYGIQVPEEELPNVHTVGDILRVNEQITILQTVPASYGGCGYFGMEEANGAGICEAAKAQ